MACKASPKPSPDTSPVRPPYSLEHIVSLLKAYGLSNKPEEKLLQDRERKAVIYFVQPPEGLFPDTFLKDSIAYFLAQGKAPMHRRVCFLFASQKGQIFSLLLDLSELDVGIVAQLQSRLDEFPKKVQGKKQTITVEDILQVGDMTMLFQRLYRKVQCLFLGGKLTPQSPLLQQLLGPLQRAYVYDIAFHSQPFVAPNPTIVLIEQILCKLGEGLSAEPAMQISEVLWKEHEKQRLAFAAAAAPLHDRALPELEVKAAGVSLTEQYLRSSEEAQAFQDPSPPLPAYTVEQMTGLLKMQEIPDKPAGLLPQDEAKQVMIYAYPAQPIFLDTLLKDTIVYFLAQGEAASNRRVCFFFKTHAGLPLALILNLTQFNQPIAQQLRALLNSKNLHTPEAVMASSEAVTLCQQLYGDVQGILLGSPSFPENQDLADQLKEPIKKAYARSRPLFLPFNARQNPTVVMVDQVLHKIRHGVETEPENRPSHERWLAHKKLYVQSFLLRLSTMKSEAPDQHAKIIACLEKLFKYLALSIQRSHCHGIVQVGATSTQQDLALLLETDEQKKAEIFSRNIEERDLETHLGTLDLMPLIQLLDSAKTSQALLKALQTSCEHHLGEIYKWEVDIEARMKKLNKRWLPYLWHRGRALFSFALDASFVRLGAGVFSLLAKPVISLTKDNTRVKKWAEKAIKKTVLFITASPDSAEEVANLLLRQDHIPHVLKFTGAGLGLAASYYMGFPFWARTISVTGIAYKFMQYCRQQQLDDEDARIGAAPSARQCLIVTQLLFSALHTYFTQNYQYIVSALGGTAGSITLTVIAQWYIPKLRLAPHQRPSQEQAYALFMLSTMGYTLGSATATLSHNIYLKVQDRHDAMAELYRGSHRVMDTPEGYLKVFHAETPAVMKNPRLWFNDDNPIRIIAHNAKGEFFSSDCEVVPSFDGGAPLIFCDEPSPRLMLS